MTKLEPGLKRWGLFSIIAVVALLALFPFYWMFLCSGRSNAEIFSVALNLVPESFHLRNYVRLVTTTAFPMWITNSIVVTASTTVVSLFLSSLAGIAFAKYRFRGDTALFLLLFLMMSVPRFVTIIPIFNLMSRLGLTNTYWSLILPFSVNPFAVFMMRQYVRSVPDELMDSARIDGYNEFDIATRIVMPLIKPAFGAAGIFILMMSWNNYVFPLVMMTGDEKMLFPVGLASLKTLYDVDYGMIMAGSFLSTLPLITGYLLFQKQFISSLTKGAIKY